MFRVTVLVLACTLVGPAVVHAQASTPAPDLPAATAPLGLGTVTLPDDAAGIAELFARLPATVAGEPRLEAPEQQSDRMVAAYGTLDPDFGPPLRISAENLATSDFEFGVDFTVADFVAIAADPTFDYGAVAFGQDGICVEVMTCPPGFADCEGTGTCSTNLMKSHAHCGACNHKCGRREICREGICVPNRGHR